MNEDLLSRVIETSKITFIKYGVKSITMDDISKELGISKKTLYTVVKGKHDLIEKTSFAISDEVFSKINILLGKKLDPISELIEIENIVCEMISSVLPSAIYQFQKYYPDIHTKLHSRQKNAIINLLHDNINRGIKDGLYREELNVDFIVNLDYNTSLLLSNPEVFNHKDLDLRKIKREYLIYHLRGIASHKGLLSIDSKLQ
ncbi:MAG: TetR/AcrR family transcriptional regulator [Flavobacteriales bacterium]|nr:TetR/AcrR family transcriptional regulator [Flavobacteriales bacterium]